MNALLDAMGATIIGAMFMLTIMTSLFTIQALSANYQRQITLVDQTERVTSILDYYYLSAVGAGLLGAPIVITEATPTSFIFNGELDNTISIIELSRGAFDDTLGTYPLSVLVDNIVNYGPIWLSSSQDGTLDGLNITYYDEGESIISYTSLASQTQRNEVRSIMVELNFFYETYRSDIRATDNSHRITFWKYFTNLYL